MEEWLIADIFLLFIFVGLMVSLPFWFSKIKKVGVWICIVAVVILMFVLSNILYFSIS